MGKEWTVTEVFEIAHVMQLLPLTVFQRFVRACDDDGRVNV